MTEPHSATPAEPGAGAPIEAAQAASQDGQSAVSSQSGAPGQGWERAALEKLAFATLLEQKTARRWRVGVRLAWLTFFVVLFLYGVSQGRVNSDKSLPHTAVVEIKGEIASGADASAELVVSAMRSAFEDDGAMAVVIAASAFAAASRSRAEGMLVGRSRVKGDSVGPGGHACLGANPVNRPSFLRMGWNQLRQREPRV